MCACACVCACVCARACMCVCMHVLPAVLAVARLNKEWCFLMHKMHSDRDRQKLGWLQFFLSTEACYSFVNRGMLFFLSTEACYTFVNRGMLCFCQQRHVIFLSTEA